MPKEWTWLIAGWRQLWRIRPTFTYVENPHLEIDHGSRGYCDDGARLTARFVQSTV